MSQHSELVCGGHIVKSRNPQIKIHTISKNERFNFTHKLILLSNMRVGTFVDVSSPKSQFGQGVSIQRLGYAIFKERSQVQIMERVRLDYVHLICSTIKCLLYEIFDNIL